MFLISPEKLTIYIPLAKLFVAVYVPPTLPDATLAAIGPPDFQMHTSHFDPNEKSSGSVVFETHKHHDTPKLYPSYNRS